MTSLALQVCRRAFPRRLQDRQHRAASADLENHLHIRNFILKMAPGIWMIFFQCSEICFHMAAVITVAGVQVVTVDLPEIAVAGVISQVAEVQPAARVLMLWLTLRFLLTRLFSDARNPFHYRIRPQARFPICPSIFRRESSRARLSDLKDRAIRAETVVQPEMCFST